MSIEIVLDAKATIGESPTWVEHERALYWIDVKRPALYRLDIDSGENREWPLTSDIGGFALIEGGGALVSLREGIYRLDLDSGALHSILPPPFDPQLFRFNEGACDAAGRFWIGVMFDPIAGKPPVEQGMLHSFTFEDGLRSAPDQAELHNGMAWSADGGTFYLSHSNSGAIMAYGYDASTGTLSWPICFATVEHGDGIPDGAAVDVEGGYWCALHGGGRLRRYHPDGSIDRDVLLPVSQPTMCAFGGTDLATLYVTSATDKLDEEQRRKEPLAGALLSLDVGTRGIVRHHIVR